MKAVKGSLAGLYEVVLAVLVVQVRRWVYFAIPEI